MKRDFSCIERKLKKQMKDYNYGQMNLLEGKFEFYSHDGDYMEIRNFHSGPSTDEVCHFQSEHFKFSNPELGLIRVYGQEPSYFNNGGNHCYLMLARKDLPENFWAMSNDERSTHLLSSNPLVIDPSFDKVVPVVDSGYTIRGTRNVPFSNTNTLRIDDPKGEWVPLGITKTEKLIAFGVHKKEASFFVKDKFKKNVNRISIDSKYLSNLLRDEEKLKSIVDLITEKYCDFISY